MGTAVDQENAALKKENAALKKENAALKKENEQKDQIIAQKDQINEQKDKHTAYLLKENTFHRNENKWLLELNANTQLSSTQKLAAWGARVLERKNAHLAHEDGLIPVFMPDLADLTGLSAKTVGQQLNQFSKALLMARKMVGSSTRGDYKKRVFVLSGETLRVRPSEAKLTEARNHGGKREKRPTCPDCGSPNVTDSHHHTCRSCGVDRIISTKEYSGVEDIPEPHPTFEELPAPVRPALALVPVCVTEEPDEEIDPYDEPVEAQKKVATCKHVPIVHPDNSQVATPPAKSPLLPMEPVARVCHNCGNANRLLWKYNTTRNKWECLVCYHYSDEYGQITS